MRRGIGRLLVEDLAARAAAAGARYVDVTANPNAVEFYSRVGFEITGRTETRFGPAPRMTLSVQTSLHERDTAAISKLMHAFLRAVSFQRGERPSYDALPDLFIPSARLIRNSATDPEITTVGEFVRMRCAAYHPRRAHLVRRNGTARND
jgi:hypothetical protein